MNPTAKKLTALLGGGVVLASGAYGIGTQMDDGSATAARSQDQAGDRRDGPFGPDALAERLGVSEEKLRAAFEDLRGELRPKSERRDTFAADLAKELGVETSEVRAALRKLRAKHRKEHKARRDEFVKKLADKLGISEDKVKDAFPAPPDGVRMRFRGPGGPGFGPGGPGGHGPPVGGPPGGPGF